jgi:hypothetical protein
MTRKLVRVITGVLTLVFASSVYSDSVVQVWECNLKDGKSREELTAVSAAWAKAARSQKGGSEMQVSLEFPLAAGGGVGGFNFVSIIPNAANWGIFQDGYNGSAAAKVDEAWDMVANCTKSSLYSSVDMK